MSLPLENNQRTPLPAEPDSGKPGDTIFMALIGALAGGAPQLLIPTATLVELIGNTIMGAVLVAVVDTILVRKTLEGPQLRRGRALLILFVAITLTLVTYRTARGVFQTTFNLAPPMEVQDLNASAYTRSRIGNIAYRISFTVNELGLKRITDSMEHLKTAKYDEFDATREPFATYVQRVLPEEAAKVPAFTAPQGMAWTTNVPTPSGGSRTSRTILLRDVSTGKTFVHHLAG